MLGSSLKVIAQITQLIPHGPPPFLPTSPVLVNLTDLIPCPSLATRLRTRALHSHKRTHHYLNAPANFLLPDQRLSSSHPFTTHLITQSLLPLTRLILTNPVPCHSVSFHNLRIRPAYTSTSLLLTYPLLHLHYRSQPLRVSIPDPASPFTYLPLSSVSTSSPRVLYCNFK